MPHLILEHTDNLPAFDVPATLRALNAVLIDTGVFPAADIKSRAVKLETYLVGDGTAADGFAALRLHTRLNDGEKKKAIAQDLLAVLKAHIQTGTVPVQFSVDILLIDGGVYAKDRV